MKSLGQANMEWAELLRQTAARVTACCKDIYLKIKK